MSTCNCTPATPVSPTGQTGLVALADHQAITAENCPGTTQCDAICVEEGCASAIPSSGAALASNLTDARDAVAGEGLTLLARVGGTLTRFVGNGFLQLIKGKAYLVNSLPIKVTHLWHKYWKPVGSLTPVLGDPEPFPYDVVLDNTGTAFGIAGLYDRDSAKVWDFAAAQWMIKPLSDFPLDVVDAIPQTTHLELVGFEEVPIGGDPANVRSLKALMGEGIVYLTATPVEAVEGGCPATGTAYVAKVLEFPAVTQDLLSPEVGRHRLVYSSHGLYWEAEV